jgi:hypothetical protein
MCCYDIAFSLVFDSYDSYVFRFNLYAMVASTNALFSWTSFMLMFNSM